MFLKNFLKSSLLRNIYRNSNSQDNKKKSIQTLSQNTTFINDVYGFELKSHVLPDSSIQVPSEKIYNQLLQQKSPNYIVALIRKDEQQGSDYNKQNSIKNSDLQFYQICTYCKVKYTQHTICFEGLCRVKIKNLQKIYVKGRKRTQLQIISLKEIQNNINDINYDFQYILENKSQIKQQLSEIKQLQKQSSQQLKQQIVKQQLKQQIIKSQDNLKKQQIFQQLKLYHLNVKKIYDLPLIINQQLSIKFNYIKNCLKKFVNVEFKQLSHIQNISHILDATVMLISKSLSKKKIQLYLQIIDIEKRMDNIQFLITDQLHTIGIFNYLQAKAFQNNAKKLSDQTHDQMLRILKVIKNRGTQKQLFLKKCKQDFLKKNPSQKAKQAFQQIEQKYRKINEHSQEKGFLKARLQDLSNIPYNVQSDQIFDLQFAERVLSLEHYGMEQIKESILEIIAVGKLKGSLKGKIFAFIGGPGLGKTTFAKSVAIALNRKFYSISLGGVTDSSVLKGHRRTYIGAYSGKIIEALKTCGTSNPVILLDEIDKLGRSAQGDPRSQLLQILDPNQNQNFVDNFIDIPIDLSRVLFICSANYEQYISKPLRDRMQIIRLSSYTNKEKQQIFKRHLLRRAIKRTGVSDSQFILSNNLIQTIVIKYSKGEPGVRYLQKNLFKILQKIAYKIVSKNDQNLPIKVDESNISQYLGHSYYRHKDHDKISAGVAISLGGDYESRLTYIQAFKKSFVHQKQRKRGLMFTGSLGNVFKQAMNISYTFTRNYLRLELNNTFLYENQIHIHAPDGASPKDGSTDSLTIASAITSLALNKKVKKGVGMTGQLTLHGRVLRTQNIKEKIILAKRERLTQIIIPQENTTQVAKIKNEICQGLIFHYVKTFKQVYEIIF